ncbi:MAG: DNA cytosine methyltransferase, partial [Syntrophaceae bacterium]|nr:DNA cytosine methyltransferase [Syntrophaceae bacterium]
MARKKGMLKDSHKTYRIVDLFAGAGGLTLGFTQMLGHVFTPVWADDFNLYAAGTYNANFGEHCTTDD